MQIMIGSVLKIIEKMYQQMCYSPDLYQFAGVQIDKMQELF